MGIVTGSDVDVLGGQEVTVGCNVDLEGPDVDVFADVDRELFGKLTMGVRRVWKVVSADDNSSNYTSLSDKRKDQTRMKCKR